MKKVVFNYNYNYNYNYKYITKTTKIIIKRI